MAEPATFYGRDSTVGRSCAGCGVQAAAADAWAPPRDKNRSGKMYGTRCASQADGRHVQEQVARLGRHRHMGKQNIGRSSVVVGSGYCLTP